ncbi:MAG TPA: TetR/AcrR family transcriptional regulator [Pseudonocardia sp.]
MAVRTERARRMPPAQRREALIAATLPLVLWHGPGVTTRQIAEAADVAEGTIFRVFDDKEALIQAVTDRAFDPAPTLSEIAAIDRALPLRARLVALVEILADRVGTVCALVNALGMARPPEGHRPQLLNDEFREAVVELVGDDRTQLRVPPPELAATLRMFVFASTHPFLCAGNPLTAEQIVGILLDGLARRDHDLTEGNRTC